MCGSGIDTFAWYYALKLRIKMLFTDTIMGYKLTKEEKQTIYEAIDEYFSKGYYDEEYKKRFTTQVAIILQWNYLWNRKCSSKANQY